MAETAELMAETFIFNSVKSKVISSPSMLNLCGAFAWMSVSSPYSDRFLGRIYSLDVILQYPHIFDARLTNHDGRCVYLLHICCVKSSQDKHFL